MSMKWTLDDLKKTKAAAINPHVTGGEKVKKKSIYGNKRCEYDGHKFDSIKEKDRYIELRFQEKMGFIKDLKLQVPFELNPGGAFSYRYIADFTYTLCRKYLLSTTHYYTTKEFVVEDVKGFTKKTAFLKKKKLMKKVHGIDIKIT